MGAPCVMRRGNSRMGLWMLAFAWLVLRHACTQAVSSGNRANLQGEPRWTVRPRTTASGAAKRIPRIIHRVDRSSGANPHEEAWRRLNPGWDLKVWNDRSCLEFVREHFPEYLDAYQSLGRNIERSDFFRYLVILQMGGVYTDSDVECRKPLDELIQPWDGLVAGWEAELSNATMTQTSEYARKRQALQWTFAAAPGHPALRDLCDFIRQHVDKLFSSDEHLDVLERTGPGPWTDAVLKHARLHPHAKKDDPWQVRILPIVQMGIYPYRQDDWTPGFPEAVVLHKFAGSWKRDAIAKDLVVLTANSATLEKQQPLYRPGYVDDGRGGKVRTEELLPFERSDKQLYPISVTWQPPFTMMVDLIGQGDLQAGVDIGARLTRWGQLQPSQRATSPVEALIGGLESTGSTSRVLVDVGAGVGYFSLAAAARGHQAIAFELSTKSVASFEASMDYNGFKKAITLHKVALGARAEDICVETDAPSAGVDIRHGYGLPKIHDLKLQAGACRQKAQRRAGASLVPQGTDVGAVRISANGWEGWVLEGLQELWTKDDWAAPAVILMEVYPQVLLRNGYKGGVPALLDRLLASGYADILHSGPRCEMRQQMTRADQPHMAAAGLEKDHENFVWCALDAAQFSEVLGATARQDEQPELVLLTYKLSRQRLAAAETISSSASLHDRSLDGPHVHLAQYGFSTERDQSIFRRR